jgi:hypothetical protein
MPSQKDKKDNHLQLTIRSTAGPWQTSFNPHNKVRVVLERGIDHFKLDPSPSSPYKVVREATGDALALDQTLGDYGIADGETILIQATRPTDG